DGGHGTGRPILIPSILVEYPPFPEVLRFRVARSGTCLNIREDVSTDAPIAGCVPDGTVLELSPGRLGDLGEVSANISLEGWMWVRVRAGDGTEGWVSSDYLDWAE
ncbi:MAG TPA: SH3 domain-containing protein, partial [Tepidiformaceae bacterium]|nr:SH3 domain-containing protein [Tepidiformaceae bacterium]